METVTSPTSEAPAAPRPAARWEDFVDIFLDPRAVFERRRDARYLVALIVVTVAMTLLFLAGLGPLGPVFESEMLRGVEAAGQSAESLTPEQLEAMRSSTRIFGTLSLLITVPVSALLTGLLLWLVGKALGAAMTFALAATIATYSLFPRILQSAVSLLQGLLLDPDRMSDLSAGPARFFDPDATSMLVMAMLMRFDLFLLWSTVLTAVGVMVIARVPASRAALVAALVWLLAALPSVLGALARG
jgi:hypothetical protein